MKTNEKTVEKTVVKPKNSYSIFPITISEWDNNGFSNYTITKSYKDGEEWKNTTSFNENDLAVILKILSKM